MVRDPFRYSETVLVLPPLLAHCLGHFDGGHTDLDLREWLVRLTGRLEAGGLADDLARALAEAGFLDDPTFATLKAERQRTFAEARVREAIHAGGGYPDEPGSLEETVGAWIATGSAAGGGPEDGRLLAIAAPHVSPSGGVTTYGSAYRALGPEHGERTFVILGTSHYGEPDRLGLTRKAFATPLGEVATDTDLVDQLALAAGQGANVEDYCHAVEHSIEFQVLFLQRLYGPRLRIVPILCGPFLGGRQNGRGRGRPEDDSATERALAALAELQARHGPRLLWVLGVDLAHVGQRYGDPVVARADEGEMRGVAARDRARLARIVDGDAAGFWELVHENGDDDLKWCGAAPLYAFLRAVPEARGEISDYAQWNIDERSVVSFAAMKFLRR
jgi:AmmeMemoRadiSam system protein B